MEREREEGEEEEEEEEERRRMGMISIPVTSDTKRRKRKRASEVGWISDGGNFILCACEASVRVRIYETNAGDVFHLLVCCCSLSLSL